MVKYTDIFVSSPVENIKEAVQQAFQQKGFKVQWSSPFEGKASRGSKGMNIAFGTVAQYYEIDFAILAAPDALGAIVRLTKSESGWAGGLIGRHRVSKQYEEIVNMLTDYFSSKGTYKGRSQT